jgi:hypothetical protein
MTKSLLSSHSLDDTDTKKSLIKSQQRQARYYDRSAKDLAPLDEDDVVRIKPFTKARRYGRKQQ